LINRGFAHKDIVSSGYSNNAVSRVKKALREGDLPDSMDISPLAPHGGKKAKTSLSPRTPVTIVKDRVVEEVVLGSILSIPEDWRLTQHGTYLLLDTFHLTKQEINYAGSMGEFIEILCEIYRQLMRYPDLPSAGPSLQPLPMLGDLTKEETDGRREEGSNGPGSRGQDNQEYS